MGGGTPATTRVTVEEWDGAPASQVEVVFVDAAGDVLERRVTGDDGVAEREVPDGGGAMLAVTYVERRGPEVETYRRVEGALGVEAGGDLTFRLTQPREQVFGASQNLTVSLATPLPAGTAAYVIPACYSEFGVLAGNQPASIRYQGCPGETGSTSVYIYLFNNDGEILGEEIRSAPLGVNSGFTFDPADVTPATTIDALATGADPSGFILGFGEGTIHSFALNPFGSQVPVPPAFGTEFWVTQQSQAIDPFQPAFGQWRRISPALPEPAFTAVTFPAEASTAAVTSLGSQDPARPTIEWTRDEGFPGDYVSVGFRWAAPDVDGATLELAVPSDRTSVQVPALPEELAVYRPTADELTAELVVVDVEGEDEPFAARAAAAQRSSALLQWSIPAP